MNDTKFKVLLYSDGSHQAFSAAVYTATLLKDMPNMHLTIVQVQDSDEGSQGTEYSWIDTWPVNPTQDWMKHVLDESLEAKQQYAEILAKTNEIYSKKKLNVTHEALFSNTSFSDTSDIPEIVNVIVDYATKNTFELVIMGTRGLSTLNGVLFGSLSHGVLDKSPIPVLLIKKLPQDFIDEYLSDIES